MGAMDRLDRTRVRGASSRNSELGYAERYQQKSNTMEKVEDMDGYHPW
jgi:hypothetical protein